MEKMLQILENKLNEKINELKQKVELEQRKQKLLRLVRELGLPENEEAIYLTYDGTLVYTYQKTLEYPLNYKFTNLIDTLIKLYNAVSEYNERIPLVTLDTIKIEIKEIRNMEVEEEFRTTDVCVDSEKEVYKFSFIYELPYEFEGTAYLITFELFKYYSYYSEENDC